MIKKNIFLPILGQLKKIVLKFNHILTRLSYNQQELNSFLKRIYPIRTQLELIRIGSDYDAGYLLPNDLKDISICFSPGVDVNASFETQLFDDYGIKSYLCDYSVDGPPSKSKGFEFVKKYLNSYEDDINMTLENWVNSTEESRAGDKILQMDIEGGEYDVISHTDKEFFKQFRIMIIEFHDLNQLFTSVGFRAITTVFDKLLENFEVVHVHPNNDRKPFTYRHYTVPHIMEFTFIRKDRVDKLNYADSYPHPLDMDNYADRKTLTLPKIFYQQAKETVI